MDIRKIINEKQCALQSNLTGTPIYENMMNEITDGGYFSKDEMVNIENESKHIYDIDTFMDNAIENNMIETYKLVGESYMIELMHEEMINECESASELTIIEESIKESALNLRDSIVNKVKELWAKFKAWLKKIRDALKFREETGRQLVNKYRLEIEENYKKKKDKMKLTTYIYTYRDDIPLEKDLIAMNVKYKSLISRVGKTLKASGNSEYYSGIKDGVVLNDKTKSIIKKNVTSYVRNEEKAEHKLGDLDLKVIIQYAGYSDQELKWMNSVEKEQDNFYNTIIQNINNVEPKNEYEKKYLTNLYTVAKACSSTASLMIKTYVSEVKSASSACIAIVKKII